MENLNELKLIKLLTIEDTIGISGGGITTGSASLFRSSLYLGISGAHAAFDFLSGAIDRFNLYR